MCKLPPAPCHTLCPLRNAPGYKLPCYKLMQACSQVSLLVTVGLVMGSCSTLRIRDMGGDTSEPTKRVDCAQSLRLPGANPQSWQGKGFRAAGQDS